MTNPTEHGVITNGNGTQFIEGCNAIVINGGVDTTSIQGFGGA